MKPVSKPRIIVGGYLPEDGSALYVNRPEDDLFLKYLDIPGTWINVYGCRTMGKTSLAVRYIRTLQQSGVQCAHIDVSVFSSAGESLKRWIGNFAIAIASSFKLNTIEFLRFVKELPTEYSCGMQVIAIFEQLRTLVPERKYIVLDEIDSIAYLPWGTEAFAAFRDAHGKFSNSGNLTLCLVGLKAVADLCPPQSASASRYASPIEMLDFPPTDATINRLREAFEETSSPDLEALRELIALTGGQPILTMELLGAVRDEYITDSTAITNVAKSWVEHSRNGERTYFEQLMHIAGALTKPPTVEDAPHYFAALNAYEELLRDQSPLSQAHTAPHKDLLLTVGLVRRNGALLESKGKIFGDLFDMSWVRKAQNTVALMMQQRQNVPVLTHSFPSDRILVINAGGTIGMVVNGEGKVVSPKNNQEFRDYFSHLKQIGEVEMEQLFEPTDSINIFPQQWIAIAKYIYERRSAGYKGIVVAHGTDTLAYTASAVAFALGPNLSFPVVFTGAQTGPNVAFGDAHVNLYRACETAKKDIPEVVICFGNYVYRAVRAQKKDDRRFEGFESPTYPPLAEITGEITVRSELLRHCSKTPNEISLKAEFEKQILIVPMFPGLEPKFFQQLLDGKNGEPTPKGIIIQTLGAGNVPILDPYSFIPFVRDAYLRGIPVIVTSHYPPDPGTHTKYLPAEAPVEAGAIHAGNMTMPAAVAKFRWVLAQVLQDPRWAGLSTSAKKRKVQSLMISRAFVGEF